MPDRQFADPRLAAIYDDLDDGDRPDLDHYEAIVDELGARRVLDVGCGTGVLACRLARRGLDVIGVDPAAASLDVARAKPDADAVTWVHGDATTLPARCADLALMTGNVAQVFVTDEMWATTLTGTRRALVDGGHLVFETRDPAFRGWEEWRHLPVTVTSTSAGPVECATELTAVELPLVTFATRYRFQETGAELSSESTLRFRERDELDASLAAAGFDVLDVRDAPDRPRREFVYIAATRRG